MSRQQMVMWENAFIHWMQQAALPAARVALFIVYAWFGLLKVIDMSPANPLVAALLERTLPFLSFDTFIIGFGWFEVLIGVLWLWSRWDRVTLVLFAAHMVMTVLPMMMLPGVVWAEPFVPTLEGQYMIKNVALVALAMSIAARLRPRRVDTIQSR